MSNLIPEQLEGKKTDIKHAEFFESREDAITCFNRAYKRMLNPRIWHDLSGVLSAGFHLQDESGKDPHRLAEEGDYLKIDIPGSVALPGSRNDWVKVALIENHADNNAEEESVGMKLIPSNAPTNKNEAANKFYGDNASSTFLITRTGNEVTSFYFGRNEITVTESDQGTDTVGHTVTSAGAFTYLTDTQWLVLINAFLQPEIGG